MKSLETLSMEKFKPYGRIIGMPSGWEENFYIVETEEKKPWRIAVFRYDNKEIQVIENHPDSKESFEPLSGITALLVAPNDNPEDFEVFLLDRPVCLEKGIWHQVLALTQEAQVKITENLEVQSVYYTYSKEKKIGII